MEADFDFIQIDMYHFLTVGANLRNLTVKIDWISATGTARNDNTDDLCFLLHVPRSFRICSKLLIFKDLLG